MTVHIQDSPVLAFREAGEAGDAEALLATLTPEAAFHSPLSATAGFQGREQLRELFHAVFDVMSDLRYHTDVGDERTRMVASTARIGRTALEESALLRLNGDGLIEEVTVWMRPLPALTAFMAALGPRMARATGRPGLPLLVSAAVGPLAAMTRLGDRTLVPMLTKRRS
ncbi:MAG: nuclear transport factor 2 family protein [Nonomuraea sp.]|nr:nuclear transport factor 2 family protein [Nonomuraea sp.]